MSMTDPIADLLTRIRNAVRGRQAVVNVPYSRTKAEIVRILKEEGYVESFLVENEEPRKNIKVVLKYRGKNQSPISTIRRISRPGCRVYRNKTEIPEVLGGLGINILTTSQGLMSGKKARELGIGGELICEVS